MMTDSREAMSSLAQSIARRFDLGFVAIALPRGGDWEIVTPGRTPSRSITASSRPRWPAPRRRSSSTPTRGPTPAIACCPSATGRSGSCRSGSAPSRSACSPPPAGRSKPARWTRSPASSRSPSNEREFLAERKGAELTRQSEQLKTALLASIGHDLRTPLTAIRVAAANLNASWLTADDRREQSELILAEVERLTRLFQNLLEMARIDAGAISTESRRVHPSEIIAAARDQVGQTLAGHPVAVTVDPDLSRCSSTRVWRRRRWRIFWRMPRSTRPAGSPIDVTAGTSGEELVIAVRDRGPGIAAADLPHLFERFYRGDAARTRTSGTGMGLWIARGLLGVVARTGLGGELPGRRRRSSA